MPVVGQHSLEPCQVGEGGVEKAGQRGLDSCLLSGLNSTKAGKSANLSVFWDAWKEGSSCSATLLHPSISCFLQSLGFVHLCLHPKGTPCPHSTLGWESGSGLQ